MHGGSAPGAGATSTSRALDFSSIQEQIWQGEQISRGGHYVSVGIRLDHAVDARMLQACLGELVRRHEALRTRFDEIAGRPQRFVMDERAIDVGVTDLTDFPEDTREAEAITRCAHDVQPFDLSQPPLLRAQLLKVAEERHFLWIYLHPMVADDWSVDALLTELGTLYHATSTARPAPLSVPLSAASAPDQAVGLHQINVAQEGQDAFHADYWQQQLAGIPALLEIPTDRPRTSKKNTRGTFSFQLSPACARQGELLARTGGFQQATLFLAALHATLHRYTGQEITVVGVLDSGRAEEPRPIDCRTEILPIRSQISEATSFRALIQHLHRGAFQACAHRHLAAGTVRGHIARQVIFEMHTPAPAGPLGTRIYHKRSMSVPAATDFWISCRTQTDGLHFIVDYRADLFDAGTVNRLMSSFQMLLESGVADPDQLVVRMPILADAERRRLLVEWNQTATDYPREVCFHQLFEAQAEKSPDAIAVTCAAEHLTYRQLNQRANQLARHLKKQGVGPDVLVGLCVHRSLEMMVGLLGILKAGGAYVPLDPTYPKDRLAYMLADARTPLLLTQGFLAAALPAQRSTLVCLDTDWAVIAREGDENLGPQCRPDDLAYVIYTSGSTGRPKGAMIRHRGLTNYLCYCLAAYPLDKGCGSLVHSSISFDLTITGLYAPLLTGRTVHLVREDHGVQGLIKILQHQSDFSVVKITPAHLELLARQLPSCAVAGRTHSFVIGGENLTYESVASWQEHVPDTILLNEYGPTETVVGCCVYRIPANQRRSGSVPIGRPIFNTQLYILDKCGQPVPIGVAGELVIGGDGVACGYLNQPEITAQKFVDDPFGPLPAKKLYRTGDLARYLSDGNIEFLGRIDHQVKIRGYRIELGEIELVLKAHPAVRDALALVREDHAGEKRLVAYVVPAAGTPVESAALRQLLKGQLPAHMVPAALVMLDKIPLTENGKVDRQALPAPDRVSRQDSSYAPPRTPAEQKMVLLWQKILGTSQVGVHDNFFDFGGDSLAAINLIEDINRTFKTTLRVLEIYQHPTVAEIAEIVGSRKALSDEHRIVRFREGGYKTPIFLIFAGPDEYRVGQLIGDEHPVYGVEVPWPRSWCQAASKKDSLGSPSLELFATPFAEALLAFPIQEPIILAGYSFGGLLAFEAARQLLSSGRRVKSLLLLDSWARYPESKDLPLEWIRSRLSKPWSSARAIWEAGARHVTSLMNGKATGIDLPLAQGTVSTRLDEQGVAIPGDDISWLYDHMRDTYMHRPLACEAVLFQGKDSHEADLLALDTSQGWKGLFNQEPPIIQVPGDHLSMIRQERHSLELGRKLREVLR